MCHWHSGSRLWLQVWGQEVRQTWEGNCDEAEGVGRWFNIEINGGDDVDVDGPVEPYPTHREVLKAVSTIGKYTNDLNDPFARKIEALLGSFTKQLRLEETERMKNTVLTDFFK